MKALKVIACAYVGMATLIGTGVIAFVVLAKLVDWGLLN